MWHEYTDGGGDCKFYTGADHAYQGNNAANIQNSGVASSFYLTDGIDVHSPGYTQIKFDFRFKAVSMDKIGEEFLVEYYDGVNWHTTVVFDKLFPNSLSRTHRAGRGTAFFFHFLTQTLPQSS